MKTNADCENNNGRMPLIFAVLHVLWNHSDEDHPLTQENIISFLNEKWSVAPDRKTIGNNVNLLRGAGFQIEGTKKGCYLASRILTSAEHMLLVDYILACRDICPQYTEEMLGILNGMVSEHEAYGCSNYRNLRRKADNKNLFYHIELLNTAIREDRQVTLTYGHYGTDLKLHARNRHTVSPVRMVCNLQRYYLISYDPSILDTRVMRVEKIMDVSMERKHRSGLREIEYTVEELAEGVMNSASPYMFSGKTEQVEMMAPGWMIDHVVDWFGTEGIIVLNEGNLCRICLRANLQSMKYWALQFVDNVEILKPAGLRISLWESLNKGAKVYQMA